MTYLLSVLYTVFLGTITRNLVVVNYTHEPSPKISVHNLINKNNVLIFLLVACLFFIDWISFLVTFHSIGDLTVQVKDGILFILYAFSLIGLSVALLNALDDNLSKINIPLAGYYFFSLVAEFLWISISIYYSPNLEKINSKILFMFYTCLIVYFLIKFFWSVLFLYLWKNPSSRIRAIGLIPMSFVFKPALLIYIMNIIHIGEIIK